MRKRILFVELDEKQHRLFKAKCSKEGVFMRDKVTALIERYNKNKVEVSKDEKNK